MFTPQMYTAARGVANSYAFGDCHIYGSGTCRLPNTDSFSPAPGIPGASSQELGRASHRRQDQPFLLQLLSLFEKGAGEG
jgi:hypothetical protein